MRYMHHVRHVAGANGAFAFGAIAKVLVVLLAFVLATVARYFVSQWAEREYDDPAKANLVGWLAFLVVLIVVGLGGLKAL